MLELGQKNRNSYALSMYTKFRVAANKTMRSILISVNSRLGLFDTPELGKMMMGDITKSRNIFTIITDHSIYVFEESDFDMTKSQKEELCLNVFWGF